MGLVMRWASKTRPVTTNDGATGSGRKLSRVVRGRRRGQVKPW